MLQKHLDKLLRLAVSENRGNIHYSVFTINNDLIGKRNCWEKANNEYKLGRFLFKEGVSVPEMHYLVPPDSVIGEHHDCSLEDWFIIMEKINGVDLLALDLNSSEFIDAADQYKAELEKVLELGIFPDDSSAGYNTVFDRSKRKTYLIDFEFWRKGTIKELDRVHRYLEDVSKDWPNLYYDTWR